MGISLGNIDGSLIKKVAEEGELSLWLFMPTLTKPLLCNFSPMSGVRRIRYLLEYLHTQHYKAFYLERVGELKGFCVAAPGGRRLKCSTRNDIVLGPYYIDEAERGKGYSKELIRLVTENYGGPYRYAYDWIGKDNIPSIKASEAVGFVRYGELKIVSKLRRLVPVNGGVLRGFTSIRI